MSLLSVSAIENTASADTNIILNADGSVTIGLYRGGTAPTPVQTGTLWYDQGGVSGTTGVVIWNGTAWAGVGGSPAATLAEAALGILTTKYSSPQTSVPKDASGMTGAAILPSGTTGQQPGTLVAGMTRYNTTTGDLEFYTGTAWNGVTAKVTGATATYDEGAALLPSGTTAQRPAAPVSGMARVNTDTVPQLEQYAGGTWQPIGVITSNLTLNVATTGNDTTGLGTVAAPWATPQRAMAYLSNYQIAQGVTVTVSVADGTYTFTTPLNLNHPNGSQITINGGTTSGARPTTSLNGGGVQGNTAGTLAFNDALLNAYYNTKWQFNGCQGLVCEAGGNVTVNTVLIRGNATGAFSGVVAGNFAGSSFYASSGGINLGSTVAVHNFAASGVATFLGGSIYAPSVTATNNGDQGIQALGGGSVNAPSAVSSNNGGNGIATQYGGSILANGATSSNNGFSGVFTNFGGSIFANNATASNNGVNGIMTNYGGSINADGATASNNGASGVRTEFGGSINASTSTASSNTQVGFLTSYGGSINCPSSTASNNGIYGVSTNAGGSIFANGVTALTNGTTNVLSAGDGFINFVGGNAAGSLSPAANSIGNGKGYILV
jgi:hypothetical protein